MRTVRPRNPGANHDGSYEFYESILSFTRHVAVAIRKGPRPSLNTIALALQDDNGGGYLGGTKITPGTSAQTLNLLFSVLAWLTLVYEPEPSSSEQIFRTAARDGPSQYLSHFRPHMDAGKEHPYFLKGFRMLLPSRQVDFVATSSNVDESSPTAAKNRSLPLNPETFSVKLLRTAVISISTGPIFSHLTSISTPKTTISTSSDFQVTV